MASDLVTEELGREGVKVAWRGREGVQHADWGARMSSPRPRTKEAETPQTKTKSLVPPPASCQSGALG